MPDVASMLPLLVAATNDPSSVALVSFFIYLAAVFLLAWLSNRAAPQGGFISEFFLGSRNLGVWAFALTFAATSASGGSFVGFPALIYTHGWVLALWIAGYMIVPLVSMGLLGKRLNQISRRAEAITIPEVMTERFGSPVAGIVATLLIVILMFLYLLAQFKAGSKILASLLSEVPLYSRAVDLTDSVTQRFWIFDGTEPDYVLCLFVFSAAVIFYVVYGGFRAVVWTDVMQGVVMFAGVLIMLVLALVFTGGLQNATDKLGRMSPPEFGQATLALPDSSQEQSIRKGTWCIADASDELVRVAARVDFENGSSVASEVPILIVTNEIEREAVKPDQIRNEIRVTIEERNAYAFGPGVEGTYLRPPGPSDTRAIGFLSLGMAFSFFAFWPFGGSGQPSNMVRLMAFRNTRTLKLSIVTVAIYYSFLYFSLVIIFCCAKVILPGMEIDADRVMPEMAVHSTGLAGVPWLAGLLLAAPFAAVMSSVDSFLLVVSSSLVCDIYKRYINRRASEKLLKRVTYGGTILVGFLATIAALHPPRYLQDIIVQASGGLAASFLIPMAIALYWRRMTSAGAISGMLTGYLTHFALTVLVSEQGEKTLRQIHTGSIHLVEGLRSINRVGIEPFIWAVACSFVAVVGVSLLTRKPSDTIVDKYFETS